MRLACVMVCIGFPRTQQFLHWCLIWNTPVSQAGICISCVALQVSHSGGASGAAEDFDADPGQHQGKRLCSQQHACQLHSGVNVGALQHHPMFAASC